MFDIFYYTQTPEIFSRQVTTHLTPFTNTNRVTREYLRRHLNKQGEAEPKSAPPFNQFLSKYRRLSRINRPDRKPLQAYHNGYTGSKVLPATF